jgi:nucleotide-binding universal stress UspA family protein
VSDSEQLVLVGYAGSEASRQALEVAARSFPRATLLVALVEQDTVAQISPYLLPGDTPSLWGLESASVGRGQAILAGGITLARALGATAVSVYEQTTASPAHALNSIAETNYVDIIVVGRRRAKPLFERLRVDVAAVLERTSRRSLLTVTCVPEVAGSSAGPSI